MQSLKYSEALGKLEGLGKFGMKLGLERISAILEAMGNPQDSLKIVHVAGTNGKGSTSTMISNTLIHAGYKTGLFISPYVLCFRERMQVNAQMISEEDFAEVASYVFDIAENIKVELTQFEIETAIAFEWYKRMQCDFVVLEVGLGGRYDSTNVIKTPLVQVIASISMDHTGVLGDTIEKIAMEKAGIIKGNDTIIYPIQKPEAMKVLIDKCNSVKSRYTIPEIESLKVLDEGWEKKRFIYDGVEYEKSLNGEFQLYNAITVIEACRALRRRNIDIKEEDVRYAIAHTYFPARMEVLSKKPLVILDGSHNPDGATALETSLKKLKDKNITVIMGVLADKDYSDILTKVATYASKFVAVTPNNPRALTAKELSEKAAEFCDNCIYYEDVAKAVDETVDGLNESDVLISCGSLYLASETRELLIKKLGK